MGHTGCLTEGRQRLIKEWFLASRSPSFTGEPDLYVNSYDTAGHVNSRTLALGSEIVPKPKQNKTSATEKECVESSCTQSRANFPEEASEQSLKDEWEVFQTGSLGRWREGRSSKAGKGNSMLKSRRQGNRDGPGI